LLAALKIWNFKVSSIFVLYEIPTKERRQKQAGSKIVHLHRLLTCCTTRTTRFYSRMPKRLAAATFISCLRLLGTPVCRPVPNIMIQPSGCDRTIPKNPCIETLIPCVAQPSQKARFSPDWLVPKSFCFHEASKLAHATSRSIDRFRL